MPLLIQLPDTVQRREAFTVEVTSYGNGCDSNGGTDVSVAGPKATIRPYRLFYRPGPGSGCADILRVFTHVAGIQIGESGTASIRILGVAQPGDRPVDTTLALVIR